MVRHFNEGIYRRVLTIWRMRSKQTEGHCPSSWYNTGKSLKGLKRNHESVVPTPRARSGRPRKTTKRKDRYLLRLCRNGGTLSANTLRADW